MHHTISLRAALVLAAASSLSLSPLGRAAEAATKQAPPAAAQKRPPNPQRAPDGPGAPKFTVAGAKPGDSALRAPVGANPPPGAEGDFLIGPDYVPAPEATVVAGVPQGTVRQFQLDSAESKFYPGIGREVFGTPDPKNPASLIVETHPVPYKRTVTVYVPSQYKAGTPAPFLVSHDGPGLGKPDQTTPHILDNLIAQHRIPALILIMIANGGGDAQGSERGLEYDTMSGKYAEFIQAEVLPAVETHYGVTLTKDPEGRATMGSSSGGSAAFAMAWYHPEWYRRVLTYSGTYVNQQWPFNPATPGGAWEFHRTLIPNSPPKPIRLWMEVGDKDNYNPNVMRDGMHDWVEANHLMARALKAKGYHYQYVFALNAGHGDRAVKAQTLPMALEWLWLGYKGPGI